LAQLSRTDRARACAQADFYSLDISAAHLAAGFVVAAECASGRVKALLWDLDEAGEWAMAASEDAVKLGATNVAALLHTGGDTLDGVPKSVQVRCCCCCGCGALRLRCQRRGAALRWLCFSLCSRCYCAIHLLS
jgi:hypothetical protein